MQKTTGTTRQTTLSTQASNITIPLTRTPCFTIADLATTTNKGTRGEHHSFVTPFGSYSAFNPAEARNAIGKFVNSVAHRTVGNLINLLSHIKDTV